MLRCSKRNVLAAKCSIQARAGRNVGQNDAVGMMLNSTFRRRTAREATSTAVARDGAFKPKRTGAVIAAARRLFDCTTAPSDLSTIHRLPRPLSQTSAWVAPVVARRRAPHVGSYRSNQLRRTEKASGSIQSDANGSLTALFVERSSCNVARRVSLIIWL